MQQRSALNPNTAMPWRTIGERLSSAILIAVSLALIALGRVDPALMEQARIRTGDLFTPMLDLAQRPISTIRANLAVTNGLFDLAVENEKLREENSHLKEWQATALSLEAQNRVLRSIVNLDPAAPPITRTEPVISEPGGVYVRSVLIAGGARDGLTKGQAAMVGPGLIGRITELGGWSARVLLITDLNSRIPVILEGTRTHAILAGDNTAEPYLMYLPKAATVNVGDRLVTAGHDGVFPTGLAIGRVDSVDHGEIRIRPIADLDRLEYVELVDGSAQSALTPEAAPAEDHNFFGVP